MDQDRDHNHVNEIDTDEVHGDADNPITESTGTAWADPVYDAAGNMTTAPKPASLANGLTCKYDAWNRLVEVKDGANVIAAHEYDGLNRRTIEAPTFGTSYPLPPQESYRLWSVGPAHGILGGAVSVDRIRADGKCSIPAWSQARRNQERNPTFSRKGELTRERHPG